MSPPGVKRRQQIAAKPTRRSSWLHLTLFFADGYHATSIARIAAAAGVAVQGSITPSGSRAILLSRVLDHAAAGERAPVPVPTFMREQAEAENDPAQIIDHLVKFWQGAPQTHRARLPGDPGGSHGRSKRLPPLKSERAAQRLHNYQIAARLLKERGGASRQAHARSGRRRHLRDRPPRGLPHACSRGQLE